MAVKSDREYRSFSIAEMRAEGENDYIVEGYASTFEPYALYECDGVTYYEQVDPSAYEGCDMSDVVFLYNHEGQVMARQKNGTLELSVDEHGLKCRADLSKTARAREMYDEIKAGLIDSMSFAFTVSEDAYDRDTRTRKICRFKKLYDVSAVCYPANPTTDIAARDYFNGVIEAEKAERLEREARERAKAKLRLLLEMED